MITRTIEKDINSWIKHGKTALLITGARQTGKTYTIRKCLNDNKTDYAEINFLEHPEYTSLFDTAQGREEILVRLSAVSKKKLIPGKTIIFFDEVQEIKDIVTMIKFLVDEGSYKYVMSGSLLGVELKNLRSAPVGYMSVLDMYPVTIKEFFLALGASSDVIENLRECYTLKRQVDDFIHQRLIKTFYLYLIIGGMPAAVDEYIRSNDLQRVAEVHDDIIKLYNADFTKYENSYNLRLKEIYEQIPGELKNENKRFLISHLGKGELYDRLKNDFLWLKDAGVALPVYNVVEPKAPLVMNEKRSLFKLFMSDVGLLTSRYPFEIKRRILSNDTDVNNGALFENAVAQELTAHGYRLYYYNSKKQGELDFIIESSMKLLPIEVKSGKDYKKHSALTNVLNTTEYGIDEAVILCNGNVSVEGKRIYLPVYMSMFLEEEKVPEYIYKIDLSEL